MKYNRKYNKEKLIANCSAVKKSLTLGKNDINI